MDGKANQIYEAPAYYPSMELPRFPHKAGQFLQTTGVAMSKPYRVFLYVLGHIRTGDVVYAHSDNEALAKAAGRSFPSQLFEVWESGRFVGQGTRIIDETPASARALGFSGLAPVSGDRVNG